MPVASTEFSFLNNVKALVMVTLVISLLGYIDYITGEISIDVLYILFLCVTAWFSSYSISFVTVLEIETAKVTADYFDKIKIGSHLYKWNAFSFLLMYFIVWILVVNLKKALSK